jgi:hypothetical protein
MKVTTSRLGVVLGLVVSTAGLGILTVPAEAVIAIVRPVHFGPFAIVRGEIARMNLGALGVPGTAPTEVEVQFLNVRGDVVKDERVTVAPGTTRYVQVAVGNPNDFPPDAFGRVTLRAVIVGFNPQPDPPGVAATLEVFNVFTGRTSIHVGNPDELPEH